MRFNRRDVAVHRVETFEHDQLWPVRIRPPQQVLEMIDMSLCRQIFLSASRLPHALDHRVVVHRVRQDQTVRHQPSDASRCRFGSRRSPR